MDNMTAKVSCFARAYHFENNKTHIFADSMAKMILGDDFNQIAESMIQGISFFIPGFEERKKKGSGLLSISSYLHQCLEDAHIVRESLWMRFQQGVTSILSLLRAMIPFHSEMKMRLSRYMSWTCRMKWKSQERISCIHNYVDFSTDVAILRKGAISAKEGEDVIIPINMKDGIILGKGLGNVDWNNSAPHGSGRIASRENVLQNHTVSEFKAEMKGVYTSCISKDTLDEAPFAYRRTDYISEAVKDTVKVEKLITPVYNYKGGNTR